MLLGRAGCLIDLAGNGNEVLAVLRRRPYDLVLMDLEMPEIDGLSAIEHIRQLSAVGTAKVISKDELENGN